MDQSPVYYSSHSSMSHHQYYQQTHHQMMTGSHHHHHHHQQGMSSGYEIMLPPPQHTMWPVEYEENRGDHHVQVFNEQSCDQVLTWVHAYAWLNFKILLPVHSNAITDNLRKTILSNSIDQLSSFKSRIF